MIGNWESNLKLPPPPPPPPPTTAPRIGLRFRSRLGLVLGFGEGGWATRQLPRRKSVPWLGLRIGLGLVLVLGGNFPRGAIVLEPI